MWDNYLIIPKYIVPPYPALVKTSENSETALLTLWHSRYGEKNRFQPPFNLAWLSVLSIPCRKGAPNIKKWTSNGVDNWGWCFKNWQDYSFVSYNEGKAAITENWSAQLDESKTIKKGERLENKFQKFAQLSGNESNATYSVYLIPTQKFRPPGGVYDQ